MSIFDGRNTLGLRLEYIRLQLLILGPKFLNSFPRYSGIPPLITIFHPDADLSPSIPLRGFNITEIDRNIERQLNGKNAGT